MEILIHVRMGQALVTREALSGTSLAQAAQLSSARRRWGAGVSLSICCSQGKNKELLKKPKVSLNFNTFCNFPQEVQWVREAKVS